MKLGKRVKRVDTEEMYLSVNEAGRANNLSASAVTRSIKADKPVKGIKFAFVDVEA